MKHLVLSLIIFTISSFCNAQNTASDTLKILTPVVKDSRIDKLNNDYKSTYKLEGYRIQIYSGTKKQPARQARMQFTQRYRDTKAHEDYESPYFKVRVGDFKTKLEALKFKNELTKYFPNCLIIKDEIEFKD